MSKKLPEVTTALALKDSTKKSKKADPYVVGGYAAHLALSEWGIGWKQLSLSMRRAILTYWVLEILRGHIWADEVVRRQRPKDWTIEEVHKIVKYFEYIPDGLSFEHVKMSAKKCHPERGSTVECTAELLGGV